jgi:hypothetical protein
VPPFLQISPIGSPPDSDFEEKDLNEELDFDDSAPLTDQLEEMIKSSDSINNTNETQPVPIDSKY